MPDFPLTPAVSVAAIFYLCLVRAFRWRRFDAIHRQYDARFKSRSLTPEEAQEVVHVAAFYDMPLLLNYSVAFALFKTYAIVSRHLLSSHVQLNLTLPYPKAIHISTFNQNG